MLDQSLGTLNKILTVFAVFGLIVVGWSAWPRKEIDIENTQAVAQLEKSLSRVPASDMDPEGWKWDCADKSKTTTGRDHIRIYWKSCSSRGIASAKSSAKNSNDKAAAVFEEKAASLVEVENITNGFAASVFLQNDVNSTDYIPLNEGLNHIVVRWQEKNQKFERHLEVAKQH